MIKELFEILTPRQRREFYKLQILVILMAFFEVIGIASIGPFMALVADPGLIDKNSLFNYFYRSSGVDGSKSFLLFLGISVLFFLVVASSVSMFTTWRLSMFAMRTGAEISDRLFKYYINQNWLFHTSASSAQLTKQITTESMRVTHNILQPFMILNARLLLALFISVGVILYSPKIACAGIFIFVGGYFFIYKVVKRKLLENGAVLSEATAYRFRLINEGLGGIRDVILLNRSNCFAEQFSKTGDLQGRVQALNNTLSQTPRYFMELVAFGSMIFLILILINFDDDSINNLLPLLAVYALSGLKLLPALQQIYSSITTIKGTVASFDAIKNDLRSSNEFLYKLSGKITKEEINIDHCKNINLINVSFAYPSSPQAVIKNINLKIPFNTTVGFVGESGSGKSTIIDLIVGLIEPSKGDFFVDDIKITPQNIKMWQSNIGFVSQSIFLTEGSIAENIAFGLNESEIDWQKIQESIKLAHLEDLIESLPNGLNTKIGERGVKLSGGQRQRIGIARALYIDAKILVFDEATSALDGLTEKKIMDSINGMKGKRTIIMIAHRLKTVEGCDCIFVLKNGCLLESGEFNYLKENNFYFKKMQDFS